MKTILTLYSQNWATLVEELAARVGRSISELQKEKKSTSLLQHYCLGIAVKIETPPS